MKKKLFIVLVIISIFLGNSKNCWAIEFIPIEEMVAEFGISEGIETAETPFGISSGNIGVAYGTASGISPFDSTLYLAEYGIIQNEEFLHTSQALYVLYYQASNGYQNAQCLVDGTLVNSGEIQLSISGPTQIVCTAEPIPDEGPDFLTYESQAGVGFTINDTIKLSITGDITIPELFPGNTEESNIVDIKVSTNTKNGYSLSAKMGTTNADLTTTSSSSKFTGLPTDASESTLADNTWGYKIKTGDSSWSNYSGLPISADTEKVLIERNTQPTSGEETTQFKIGAHASTSMPADTYSNTIIFHAVANPAQ